MALLSYSPIALEATEILGARIKLARKGRRLTVAQLAERVGVSRVTIQKIERCDPTVAIGTMFEAATLLGVVLFHAEPERRRIEALRVNDLLALLPETVRVTKRDDDF
jgi:transcriptional regulator with XRE-family HTH domain